MGDGVSKFGCYCMQRDEDHESAAYLASLGLSERDGADPQPHAVSQPAFLKGFGRKRGINLMSERSPRKKGAKNSKVCKGPLPSCEPSGTVIIFDWDDTLLCSAAINQGQYTAHQLKNLEKAAETVLETAMQLGETIIVTNGNKTWVEESAERYYPGLKPILAQLRVLSARSLYEPAYPHDPFAWKRMAFREILARRQMEGLCPDPTSVNLVVIGDSVVEMEAAKASTKVLAGHSLVKTLKFKEAPSAYELLGELRKVNLEIAKIVQLEHKLSRLIVPRILPVHLDHLHSWAAGWQFSDGSSHLSRTMPAMLHF